jgi:predicted transcriptional regulator of viral defense system
MTAATTATAPKVNILTKLFKATKRTFVNKTEVNARFLDLENLHTQEWSIVCKTMKDAHKVLARNEELVFANDYLSRLVNSSTEARTALEQMLIEKDAEIERLNDLLVAAGKPSEVTGPENAVFVVPTMDDETIVSNIDDEDFDSLNSVEVD